MGQHRSRCNLRAHSLFQQMPVLNFDKRRPRSRYLLKSSLATFNHNWNHSSIQTARRRLRISLFLWNRYRKHHGRES